MQVGDLLHAEPAELAATHGAGHVITAAVVHLNDVGAAARTRLDVIGCRKVRFKGSRLFQHFFMTASV